MTERNLAGLNVLITGGARGVGAATARRVAAAGANVAISYFSSTDQAAAVVDDVKNMGVRAVALQADQGNRDEAARLVRSVADELGSIDVLVNNAGIFLGGIVGAPNATAIPRQWAVNVTGMTATTEAAIEHMPDGGRIVLVSSLAATRTSMPGFGDYAATKAAVQSYGRSWAHDLAPRDITVNTVELGFVDTDMTPPADGPIGQSLVSSIPLGRYGRVEEIANVIAFVVSPEASYLTGSTIRVDGGWNA